MLILLFIAIYLAVGIVSVRRYNATESVELDPTDTVLFVLFWLPVYPHVPFMYLCEILTGRTH